MVPGEREKITTDNLALEIEKHNRCNIKNNKQKSSMNCEKRRKQLQSSLISKKADKINRNKTFQQF